MENNFKVLETPIQGLVLIEPRVFGDHRGFFLESYSKRHFLELGIRDDFVQDNHSKSGKNVLRGIHLQKKNMQGKLVRVVRGKVYDVAVDLRRASNSFGQWFGVELSADNKRMLYLPEGFGHGFITLEEDTEFLYKTTDYYHPEDEGGIRFDDPDLKIQWPFLGEDPILSDKDMRLGSFNDYKIER